MGYIRAPPGKYDEQLKTKDRLLEENVTIKEETKALMAQLEKEQGNLSVYHDKVSEKDHNHLNTNIQLISSKPWPLLLSQLVKQN